MISGHTPAPGPEGRGGDERSVPRHSQRVKKTRGPVRVSGAERRGRVNQPARAAACQL